MVESWSIKTLTAKGWRAANHKNLEPKRKEIKKVIVSNNEIKFLIESERFRKNINAPDIENYVRLMMKAHNCVYDVDYIIEVAK